MVLLEVLFLELFSFCLVSLSLFIVISLEPIVDLCEDVRLEPVQVLLRDRALGSGRVQGLWHGQGVQVCLPSDEV